MSLCSKHLHVTNSTLNVLDSAIQSTMDAENLHVNAFTVIIMCGCDERNFWIRRHESAGAKGAFALRLFVGENAVIEREEGIYELPRDPACPQSYAVSAFSRLVTCGRNERNTMPVNRGC